MLWKCRPWLIDPLDEDLRRKTPSDAAKQEEEA